MKPKTRMKLGNLILNVRPQFNPHIVRVSLSCLSAFTSLREGKSYKFICGEEKCGKQIEGRKKKAAAMKVHMKAHARQESRIAQGKPPTNRGRPGVRRNKPTRKPNHSQDRASDPGPKIFKFEHVDF